MLPPALHGARIHHKHRRYPRDPSFPPTWGIAVVIPFNSLWVNHSLQSIAAWPNHFVHDLLLIIRKGVGEGGGAGRECGARETQIETETEKEKQRLRKAGRQAGRQAGTKLVFYAQSTSAVISGRQTDRNRYRETETERRRQRHRERVSWCFESRLPQFRQQQTDE